MIRAGVLGKSLWERRRSYIAWSAGLAFIVLITVAPYGSFKDDPALKSLTENLPDFVRAMAGGEVDFLSPEGWLNGRLFALMLPLLFATFAIGRGADGIAGEEGKGTLELVLSSPVSRSRFALEKFAAVAAGLALLAAVTLGVLALTVAAAGMEIPVRNLAMALAGTYLLSLFHGSLALAVGAATGRRGIAVATAGAVAVAGYLVDTLAELWDIAERLRFLSPFAYADAIEPLRGDAATLDLVVLDALIAAALAGGIAAFTRRDLRS